MDEMGVNAYRTAHYQQSQHVLGLADRRGYVVWTEIPLVNQVTDSAGFRANVAQPLCELIRQNFNHPSVFFWGIGNEQATDNAVTNGILDALAKQADAEDSGRLSTYATHKGDADGRNDKGLVTYDRQVRKDAFYYYKANWSPEPTVYLASRRWTQRTAAATTVKVYANLDAVTLTVNGLAQGAKAAADRVHTWPVTLRPGANVVSVTGEKNGRSYTDTVTWTLAG
ncbi:glycoside hydrolase family 2 TIM barrel-domain containing protein [Crossiella sp. CA-258035]|uniref:glycoside hydrolase family 2 TIM barrel-domain containing protein n=1 Tax=Crossiella sp. CA-258035 TaxID=2981138 RepID=UPI0024BBEE18|nr:glycoside hydrolase family 2 TIM barrel-domain containing protein [Crossiella sp. CA-258035]WHT17266.1 glycoside hydrolase family 2 TIM barrel-domain containing protein [Crossiella sp. CA-258035]